MAKLNFAENQSPLKRKCYKTPEKNTRNGTSVKCNHDDMTDIYRLLCLWLFHTCLKDMCDSACTVF